MHQNPEAHFKRVQSLKFFSILKQKQPQGFSNYFTSTFLSNIYRQLNRMSTAVYINDKKINEELFADLFSQYYHPHLCSYADLVNFYLRIRDVFTSQYQSQDQMTKLNKEIFLSKFDKQSKENYVYQISVIADEIRQNISYESYEDIIVKFNYCFMSFYLEKENFLKGFYEICRVFMQKVIIQMVLKEISCKRYEEQSYKSLLFICDAGLTFPDIHKLLTLSIYLQKDYWPIFRDSLERFISEDDSKQGVTMIAFFNVFMRLKPEFIEFLLIFLAQNSNHSNLIDKSHKLIHNLAFTRQLIEFYAFLLDINFNRYQYFQPKMVLDIQYYAVKVLNSNQRELFCASISLINETIKYNVENDAIMIIFQALQANDLQLNQSILLVLQTGLRVNNSQIVETLLVRRAKYIPILLRQLSVPIKQEFSSHCLCLEIIYLMIRPDFFLCFGDLLKCLEAALEASDIFATYVSEILKQLCILLQNSEISSRMVNSESIFKVALKLLALYDRKDECVTLLQFDFPFVKKQFIRNITEAFISYFQNQNLVKEAEKDNTSHKFLYDAYYFFGKLIGNSGVQPNILELLKEQIQVKGFKKKIYGAIFTVCQNIIFFFGSTETSIKVRMQQHRKCLLACFYQYFTFEELISEKIPIFIEFSISFELFRFHEVERLLPVGTTYHLFQMYCQEIMQKMIEKQRYQHEIRPIFFKDRIFGNAQVRDASSYRKLIDRCLKDSKRQYKISVFIEQDNYPVNSYDAMPSVSISPFNTASTTFQSLRSSPRVTGSQVLSNRSSPRSPSSGRQTVSRVIPNQNSTCEKCGRPSFQILCDLCNRR